MTGNSNRRRLTLDTQDCFVYLNTSSGLRPLTNPLEVKKSSKDPNRNLYPRSLKRLRQFGSSEYSKYDPRSFCLNAKMEDFNNDDFDVLLSESLDEYESSNSSFGSSPQKPFIAGTPVLPRPSVIQFSSPSSNGRECDSSSMASTSHQLSTQNLKRDLSQDFQSAKNLVAGGSSGNSQGQIKNNFPSMPQPISVSNNVGSPSKKIALEQVPGSGSSGNSFAHQGVNRSRDYAQPCNQPNQSWSPNKSNNCCGCTAHFNGPNVCYHSVAQKKPRKKDLIPQSNTLLKYFEVSPSKRKLKPENPVIPTLSNDFSMAGPSTAMNSSSNLLLTSTVSAAQSEMTQTKNQEEVMIIEPFPQKPETHTLVDLESSSSVNVNAGNNSLTDLECTNAIEEFKDVYGLLGSGDDSWDELNQDCSFDKFPDEILEMIFYQMPIQDLCLSLNLVSRRWNSIISNPRFIPWKKFYYRLKSQDDITSSENIVAICQSHSMSCAEFCLVKLPEYMKCYKDRTDTVLLESLKHHSKYRWAFAVLKERLPECLEDGDPNPWSLLAVLCILSHTVDDVYDIIKVADSSKSSSSLPTVIDCLYCIASFLLHFKLSYKVNPGLHYRVYYALYLFENTNAAVRVGDIKAFSTSSAGQQNIQKYGDRNRVLKLTQEQRRIVNHPMGPDQVVKIIAFAGTGKTTTLIELTKMWPNKSFLNIIYNKATCDFAKKIFPSNVVCRTMHSLAYETVGNRYRGRLKTKLRPSYVCNFLPGENVHIRSLKAVKAIEIFLSSADEFITIAHVPSHHSGMPLSENEKLTIARDAESIWEKLRDPRNFKAQINHDVYLKLYQLSSPVIRGYDCVVVDEAQDFNPAMLDIIAKQTLPKIMVGDPHQQVYAFRGAVNALDFISATHTYYLTQSFRFGPEIAYVASCALEVMKHEHRKTIVGRRQQGSINGQREGQLAIIARNNVTLFNEAVRLCYRQNAEIRGAFTGGLSGLKLDQMLDIQKLMLGNRVEIRDKFIGRYRSFDSLYNYAKQSDDKELLNKVRIVRTYNHQLEAIIAKIKDKCRYPLHVADVVFTTAHKSKGLEFDTVQLTEDFVPDLFRFNPCVTYCGTGEQVDEANILYVAITRAKKRLIISSQVMTVLLAAGEKLEFPHWIESLKGEAWYDSGNWRCISCGERRKQEVEKCVVIIRKETKLAMTGTVKGGPLCHICATAPDIPISTYNIDPPLRFPWMNAHRPKDYYHESMKHLVGPITPQEVIEADNFHLAEAEDEDEELEEFDEEIFGILDDVNLPVFFL